MRLIFVILFVISSALFGCISEQKYPLVPDSLSISQNNDELAMSANFSGNDIPKETKARLTLWTATGEKIYDREFFMKESEFTSRGNKTTLTRHIKLTTTAKVDAAELTLMLPNGMKKLTAGSRALNFNELDVEVVAHETQYAVFLEVPEPQELINRTLYATILDNEGMLHQTIILIAPSMIREKNAVFFIPYQAVPKSFYKTGNLLITFNGSERRTEIPLRHYTAQEAHAKQEGEFIKNAQGIANGTTEYVGFKFNVTRAGIYRDRAADELLVRFDAELANALLRPQYLIRSDFYMKDEKKTFYPVLTKRSSNFGPLLMASESVNASFYFLISAPKDRYAFYYGDKKLAEYKIT